LQSPSIPLFAKGEVKDSLNPPLAKGEVKEARPLVNAIDSNQTRVRIDKWLWAARFFKTRGLAQAAVVGGKVKLRGERVKPAKEVCIGDELAIHIGEYEWVVTVKGLSDHRGPAAVALGLYDENEESRVLRITQIAERKAQGSVGGERKGRPTKRERRQIIRFRQGG
jgi:ribosome-associated heat shock protein Hsp15